MSERNEQQDAALYGPAGHGDYSKGDAIRFRDASGRELTGEVLYVRAPGPAIQGGKVHPMLYMVYVEGEGFPRAVYASDVIEAK